MEIPLSLDNIDEEKLTLSNGNKKWIITRKEARMSKLLDTAITEDQRCQFIEIKKDDWIIDKVVDFIKYHSKIPMEKIEKPIKSHCLEELADEWDCNFIDIDNNRLLELVNTADYLHIEDLLALCLAKIACIIKIKKKFN